MTDNLGNLGNYGIGVEIHLDALTAALDKMTAAVTKATNIMSGSFDKMSVRITNSTGKAGENAEKNLKKISEVASQLPKNFTKASMDMEKTLTGIVKDHNLVKEAVKGSAVSYSQANKSIRDTNKTIEAQNKLLEKNLQLTSKYSSQGGLGSSKYQQMLARTAPTTPAAVPDIGGMLANALSSDSLMKVSSYNAAIRQSTKQIAVDYTKAAETIKKAGLAEKMTLDEVSRSLQAQAAKSKLLDEASRLAGMSVSQLTSQFKDQKVQLEKNIGFFEKMGSTMLTTLRYVAAYRAINMFENSVSASFELYKNLELTNIQYKVLLGNSEAAKALFGSLVEYARNTVYEVDNVTKSAGILLASGISSNNILPVMKKLGDLAGGDGEKLEGLSKAFGKVAIRGRANMMQLNQFITRQIPIMEALAQVTGKTTAELTEMSRKNQIGFSDMAKAIDLLTAKGGKFYKMTEEQGNTTAGILNQVGENSKLAGTALLNLFDPAIKTVSKSLLTFVNGVKDGVDWLIAFIEQHPKLVQASLIALTAIKDFTIFLTKYTIKSFQLLIKVMWDFRAITIPFVVAGIVILISAIGAVPLAIGGIVTAIALAYEAWKTNFGNFKSLIMKLGDLFNDLGKLISATLSGDDWSRNAAFSDLKKDANSLVTTYTDGMNKIKKSFKDLTSEFKKGTVFTKGGYNGPDIKGLNLSEIEDSTGEAGGGRGKRNASSLSFDKTVENIKENLRKKHQATMDSLSIAEQAAVQEDAIRKELIAEGISEYSDYYKQLLSLIMDKIKKEEEIQKNAEEEKVAEITKINTEAAFKIRQIKESNLKNQTAAVSTIEKNKAIAIANTEKTIHLNMLDEMTALQQSYLAKVERMKKESSKKVAGEEFELQLKIDSFKLSHEIDTIENINNFALARGEINQKEFLRRELELQKKRQELAELSSTRKMKYLEQVDPNYKNNIEYKNLEADKTNITQQESEKAKQIERQILLERQKNYKDFFDSINDSFSQSIGNFIMGTEYWTDTVANLFSNLQRSFANLIANMVKDWITGHITMGAITDLFTGKKVVGNAAISASNNMVAVSNATVSASEAVLNTTAQVTSKGIGELTKSMGQLALSSLILAVTMPIIALSTLVMGVSSMVAALGLWLLAGAMTALVPLSLVFAPFAILMAVEFAVIAVGAALLAAGVMAAAIAFKALAVAAAAASAAVVPVIGWAIAPAAAVATGAAISMGARVPGFDKGAMRIPQDMVAQVHKDETILPKPFADDFRSSLKGKKGEKTSSVVNHIQINNPDKSFMDKFDDNMEKIVRRLNKEQRKFKMA